MTDNHSKKNESGLDVLDDMKEMARNILIVYYDDAMREKPKKKCRKTD
jgi:hypothetical protein